MSSNGQAQPTIQIAGREIGAAFAPYIIAEISANHNGRIENALKIVSEAKKAGADAVKLQTYTADTITLNSDGEDFQIRGGLWDGRTLHDLYREAHMPWEWHKPIFEHATKLGISAFSTPFDFTAVDFLEDCNVPAYKIASFEAVDLPLIKYVAGTGKPMIISTGMADDEEIAEAVEAARSGGCRELALLHCVSGYPAPAADYNLKTISDMAERFGTVIGLSDHTLDNTTAITSVALGASVIEKHVTLDRSGCGPDDSFSLEPPELQALCDGSKIAWEAVGTINYGKKSSEIGNAQFRRSLYFAQGLEAGEVVTEGHVRSVRPGYGLKPKHYEAVIGRRATRTIEPNTPVTWDALDGE